MNVGSAAFKAAGVATIGAAAVAAVVFLVGAGPAEPEDRIRVGYFPNVGHAIPIVGLEKGTFVDHLAGTEVETKIFDSGPQVIESMFAGSIDIAYVGPGPAINGYINSRDGSLKILGGAASGGASFVVHPESFKEDFGFDGKRIAAPQIGNTQDVSLRHYLSDNNLRPVERGGSVVIYNVANPDIYTLFVKGDIDGAWVAEPWATILERELGGTRLFYEEDLWPNNEFASVLLVANMDYVERNPEIIYSWLNAHEETAGWINENPEEAGMVFNGFLADLFGRGLDETVVDVSLSNIRITPDPLEESVHTFAERADGLGYLGRHGYDLSGIFYDAGSN